MTIEKYRRLRVLCDTKSGDELNQAIKDELFNSPDYNHSEHDMLVLLKYRYLDANEDLKNVARKYFIRHYKEMHVKYPSMYPVYHHDILENTYNRLPLEE